MPVSYCKRSKKREANYDLLRIISTIAVVSIHVISVYRSTIAKDFSLSTNTWENGDALIIAFLDALPRFSVPCFLMLTGAFLFDDEKIYKPGIFYKAKFQSLGIHFLIFIIFSILFQICFIIFGEDHNGASELVINLAFGLPFYHMWYIYMYIGIIALAPFFAYAKELWEKIGYRFPVIYLIWSSLSAWLSGSSMIAWNIGYSFCWFSYVIMGYFIKKRTSKNNYRAFRDISGGVLLECLAGIVVYWHIIHGMDEIDLSYQYIDPFCPIIVIASVLIFKGFSEIKTDLRIAWKGVSLHCLIVYLIHPFIWEVLKKVIYHMRGADYIKPDEWILFYFVYFFVVLFLSSVSSSIYLGIYQFLANKVIFADKQ